MSILPFALRMVSVATLAVALYFSPGIPQALAETAITIPCGTYTYAQVVTQSGTSDNWVRYTPTTPRCATITGGTTPSNRSYYILDNFIIDGSGGGTAVYLQSSNVKIINNEIRGPRDITTGDANCSEGSVASGGGIRGLYHSQNVNYITIEDNDIHGFLDPLDTDLYANEWIIRNNYFHNNHNGFAWNSSEGRIVLDNNVFWDNSNHAMEIGQNDSADPLTDAKYLEVTNNIFAVGQEGWYGLSGKRMLIKNNTFFGPTTPCAPQSGGLYFNEAWGATSPFRADGPVVYKNNIVYTYQTASWSNMIGYASAALKDRIETTSDYNIFYLPGSTSRQYGVLSFAYIGGMISWSTWNSTYQQYENPQWGQDEHSLPGTDPLFTGPNLTWTRPATIAEARARLQPQAGSPACTGGEGGTYIGAVSCAGQQQQPGDTEAPTVPTNLAASISLTQGEQNIFIAFVAGALSIMHSMLEAVRNIF